MTQFLAKRHTEYISDSREEFPAQENYKMQVDFTISHRFGDSFLCGYFMYMVLVFEHVVSLIQYRHFYGHYLHSLEQ